MTNRVATHVSPANAGVFPPSGKIARVRIDDLSFVVWVQGFEAQGGVRPWRTLPPGLISKPKGKEQ